MDVLVTGATGNVGRHVVSQLLADGGSVRALVRDPDGAALAAAVDVRRGDFGAPETVEAAVRGAETVFSIWPLFTAGEAPAVVEALARHARRAVYLSTVALRGDLAEQQHPYSRFHAAVQRSLAESALEATILRAAKFARNTLAWASEIRAGVVRLPYPGPAHSPVDERDIAAVAVAALSAGLHEEDC